MTNVLLSGFRFWSNGVFGYSKPATVRRLAGPMPTLKPTGKCSAMNPLIASLLKVTLERVKQMFWMQPTSDPVRDTVVPAVASVSPLLSRMTFSAVPFP